MHDLRHRNWLKECNTLAQKQNKNTNKDFLNKTIILYKKKILWENVIHICDTETD